MSQRPRDEEREHRLHDEIILDAYGPEEQALSWYYYLEEKLQIPFQALCTAERRSSPLCVGESAQVVGLPTEEESEHELFVLIRWDGRTLAVPLAQLVDVDGDDPRRQAIKDWRYWVERGYEL